MATWQLNGNYTEPPGKLWCEDYHMYGSVWKFGEIDFTVDGVVTHVYSPTNLQSGWT
jgi:Glycosyl hydrolases family 16